MSHVRYVELYVPCPRCQAYFEAAVTHAHGRVEVLRHDLYPNELDIDGYPLNSARDLRTPARTGLASAGLI